MTSKRTRQLDADAYDNDTGGGDEARLNLWAATGTLEATDVSAFRRGETDLGALEARHGALVEAIRTAQTIQPPTRDCDAVASVVPRLDRWTSFRESA